MISSSSIDEVEHYSYELELELYNGNSDIKIMMNIEIIFKVNDKVVVTNVPHDNALKVNHQHFTTYYDVEPINILPKIIQKYKFTNAFSSKNELSFIWNITEVALRYIDEKGKLKVVLVKKENYKTYFDRHIKDS